MKEYEKPVAEIISLQTEAVMNEDVGIGDLPSFGVGVEDWGDL